MTDFDHWKVLLTRLLLRAVQDGELPADFLHGFLLRDALNQPDTDPEDPSSGLATSPGTEPGEAARRKLVELLKTPREERRGLIRRERGRFSSPHLVDELIEEVRDAVLRNHGEALELARLALDVAHRVDPVLHGMDRRLETLARASAHEANAVRVGGDLKSAEMGLDLARQCLDRVDDPAALVEAELDGLLASLRADQRRFEEFHRLIDRVVARYREHGEQSRTAHFLVKKGIYLHYEKRSAEAVDVLVEARALITPEKDPWLCLCAEHQMAWILCDMGHLEAAGARLEANRDLYERFGSRTELRRQWVEARVAHGLGETRKAERLYRAVRDGFLEQQSGYDAASVALDLARMYLEQERSREVRKLAEEMLPVFRSQDIHPEAMAALHLFRDAADQETASVDLVRRLASYLEQARNNPSLRFDASFKDKDAEG